MQTCLPEMALEIKIQFDYLIHYTKTFGIYIEKQSFLKMHRTIQHKGFKILFNFHCAHCTMHISLCPLHFTYCTLQNLSICSISLKIRSDLAVLVSNIFHFVVN